MKQKQQHQTEITPGYGPNNPEPPQFKDSANSSREEPDALHAALEYIEGKNG